MDASALLPSAPPAAVATIWDAAPLVLLILCLAVFAVDYYYRHCQCSTAVCVWLVGLTMAIATRIGHRHQHQLDGTSGCVGKEVETFRGKIDWPSSHFQLITV